MDPSGATVTTPLRIDIIDRSGSLVLVVHGELDIATASRLDDELAQALSTDAETITVDLSGVSFIDSSGLQVLIKHARAPETGPRIRLTRGSPQARRLFELTGAIDYLRFVSE